MFKFTIIEKMKDGSLVETQYFGTDLKEIKKLEGFIAVVKKERVKHPKAETLQRVILSYQVENTVPDLISFYTLCDEFSKETPDIEE